ncbi:helix-turn-helix transcriptional regulator [Achromobacter pestifer]|nr:AraC family transcriptional regulator [Achromobacter pestifer]
MAGEISPAQLRAAGAHIGGSHDIESRHGAGARAPLEGSFQVLAMRPGLTLRRADVRDCGDNVVRSTLAPGLKLIVLEHGDVELEFGHHHLRLQGPAAGEGLQARLLMLTGPASFMRRAARNHRERSITLTAAPQWLQDGGLIPDGSAANAVDTLAIQSFLQTHLALHAWTLTPRGVTLAQRIARPPAHEDGVDRLMLESRCLALLGEGLRHVALAAAGSGAHAPASRIDPRHAKRLLELRARMDAGAIASHCTLSDLAAQTGLGVRALQQGFQALTGSSAVEYLREQRLRAAQRALIGQGVSVSQAAALAGYSSAANFATAFKRLFGVSPRDVRMHG